MPTDTPATHVGLREALGESPVFLDFQDRLSAAAKVNRPVLLIGERGTGKELAAAKLHYLSPRWEHPLVALNCAALSQNLVEAELFGHEPGAFTGAARRRAGRFEAADGGTLFLDEIAVIPIPVQEKILRVVEYATFQRVGSSDPMQVDVRIIGATNTNLKLLAEEGTFMKDLLDRLSFEVLFIPPLRERNEDIVLLANHFASRMAHELGRERLPEFTTDSIDQLMEYAWPGNVRELKNVVERAVYRSDTAQIGHIEFDPFDSPFAPPPTTARPDPVAVPATPSRTLPTQGYEAAIEDLEYQLLDTALKKARHNQRRAADLLKLTYHQFRGQYRKHRERWD